MRGPLWGIRLVVSLGLALALTVIAGTPFSPSFSSAASPAATLFEGEIEVSLGSAVGANGEIITVPLALSHSRPMQGLQLDLTFDPTVALFVGGEGVLRGESLVASFGSSGAGRLRAVFYLEDNTELASGKGQVASLRFRLVGDKDDVTDLSPSGVVFSAPDASEWPAEGAGGTLEVNLGPPAVPVFQIVALKNPGRLRILQTLLRVEHGSGGLPIVQANGEAVVVEQLAVDLFSCFHFVAEGVTAVLFEARDSNAKGTGFGRETVAF